MQMLINVPDSLPQAIIQKYIKQLEEGLKKEARKSEKIPNEETKAAMLDVCAKKNLENISLEQLQQDCNLQ